MTDTGKTIVLKFGGSAFQPEALRPFAERVRSYTSSGHKVVIVHGGGKEISRLMDALDLKSVFIDGLRVTDEAALDVVEMVLCGRVNKALVRALLSAGVESVGLSGQDGALLVATPLVVEKTDATGRRIKVDYGRVGDVARVNLEAIHALLARGFVPVVAPLGITAQGLPLNLNADPAAAALAGALKADLFALLTDVPGVLITQGGTQTVAHSLSAGDIDRLKGDGTIKGGMIPKVDCCLAALRAGAKSSLIASLEAFTHAPDFQGTRIVETSP